MISFFLSFVLSSFLSRERKRKRPDRRHGLHGVGPHPLAVVGQIFLEGVDGQQSQLLKARRSTPSPLFLSAVILTPSSFSSFFHMKDELDLVLFGISDQIHVHLKSSFQKSALLLLTDQFLDFLTIHHNALHNIREKAGHIAT